jgi:hypothetical protein
MLNLTGANTDRYLLVVAYAVAISIRNLTERGMCVNMWVDRPIAAIHQVMHVSNTPGHPLNSTGEFLQRPMPTCFLDAYPWTTHLTSAFIFLDLVTNHDFVYLPRHLIFCISCASPHNVEFKRLLQVPRSPAFFTEETWAERCFRTQLLCLCRNYPETLTAIAKF